MALPLETKFAPAERADEHCLSRDLQLVTRSALLDHLSRTIPCVLLILNKQRQIIYANQCVLDLLGSKGVGELVGKRPGEMIGCIHAVESPSGCGTTEFCRECGAVLAILQSQSEKVPAIAECTISTVSGESYEFKVWASPYTFGDTEFTAVSLLNIHDEKRRQTLERVFFHDVGNLLMSLVCYSEILASRGDSGIGKNDIEGVLFACRQLRDEIYSQQRLLQAENGELTLNIRKVNSRSLIEDATRTFSAGDSWNGRTVLVGEGSEEVEIETDREILLRVILNMVKNALEASPPGGSVRISCTKNGSSAIFSVNNQGCMPDPVRLRVFQRSFSTKGKGRGIGTYSMKLFGEKYLKGEVGFTSAEDDGTTFFISLPLVQL